MSKEQGADKVQWGSKIGVVLAVAGSAVGLGNFLRFPGQAAQNGAGAFMIPYFIALLIVGIPLAWAEWSMGRFSGVRGLHSAPGVFANICRNRWASLIGSIALLIPLCVYMYYVVIEAWCLGYAYHYLTGDLIQGADPSKYNEFFDKFTGANGKGDALDLSKTPVAVFVVITFLLNFALILCGLIKGIESFCKFAMPMMIICALFVLVRVLTLGTPEFNAEANLKLYQLKANDQLESPERQLWLAIAQYRAGQKDAAVATAKSTLKRTKDLPAFVGDVKSKIAGLEAEIAATPSVESDSETDEDPLKKLEKSLAAQKKLLENLETELALEKPQDYSAFNAKLEKIASGGEPDFIVQSVESGLNFMWNPDFEKLKSPKTWMAAAGQIFFSLSVGFGVIINYASYVRRREDIALSGLTAASTNEFFEVVLGGLITLPAAFIFLGLAAGTFGTFGLGFNALPNVFAQMQGGWFFGFLWFFMLFLAAITSSLSMLQPVMAFIEEGLGLKRVGAAILLGLMALVGSTFVVYYSEGLAALDNIDFWVGTFLIVVLATIQSIIYGWVFGVDLGDEEMRRGAQVGIPRFLPFMLKYITPVFLVLILGFTIFENYGKYATEFAENKIARYSVFLILGFLATLIGMILVATIRWSKQGRFDWENPSKP